MVLRLHQAEWRESGEEMERTNDENRCILDQYLVDRNKVEVKLRVAGLTSIPTGPYILADLAVISG